MRGGLSFAPTRVGVLGRAYLMGARGGIRLWPLIDKVSNLPHWMWKGATSPTTGYGCARGNRRQMTSAHRAVWEMINGDIPEGMNVCHHCDIRLCVNPNCLFLGTQEENIADARAKGRLSGGPKSSQRGELNNANKYTYEQIDEVRRLLDEGLFTQRHIARITGVHYMTVWDIKKGNRWNSE